MFIPTSMLPGGNKIWTTPCDAADAEIRGSQPGDGRAGPAVDAYAHAHAHARAFARETSSTFRRWLAEELTSLTDPCAERWWQLTAELQPTPNPPNVPRLIDWVHQALAGRAGL